MDKKGTVNLSINMIIVLIIAIIILGFALSFITGMFRKAETSLAGQFPEPKVTVNAENPIGIGSEFLIEPGETRKMSIPIYNTQNSEINTGAHEITCELQGGGTANDPEIIQMESVPIPIGETKTVKTIIQGKQGMNPNSICTITIGPSDGTHINQTFFIKTE